MALKKVTTIDELFAPAAPKQTKKPTVKSKPLSNTTNV